MKHLKGCGGGDKRFPDQIKQASAELSKPMSEREEEGVGEGGSERGFVINFHFLCLIIPSPNEISEEEINLPAVAVHLTSRNSYCSPLLSLSL